MNLRKFRESDSNFLIRLRNSNDIRKWCRYKEIISAKQHNDWLKAFINNKNNIGYIIGDNIGAVRIEDLKGACKVHIQIMKKYRRKGYGTKVLKKLSKLYNLTADVYDENKIAIKVFNDCGIKVYGVTNG